MPPIIDQSIIPLQGNIPHTPSQVILNPNQIINTDQNQQIV